MYIPSKFNKLKDSDNDKNIFNPKDIMIWSSILDMQIYIKKSQISKYKNYLVQIYAHGNALIHRSLIQQSFKDAKYIINSYIFTFDGIDVSKSIYDGYDANDFLHLTMSWPSDGYHYGRINVISPNGEIYTSYQIYYTCLTQNALITMSDYSQKYIKDIQVEDQVLTINQQTGQIQPNIVQYNSKIQNIFFDEYDIYCFENDYKVQTLNRHRFYNIDRKAFIYMDEWNTGQKVRTLDGKELKLIKHQHIKQRKQAYTIKTKNETYIANNLFTGTRLAKPITPFDI